MRCVCCLFCRIRRILKVLIGVGFLAPFVAARASVVVAKEAGSVNSDVHGAVVAVVAGPKCGHDDPPLA